MLIVTLALLIAELTDENGLTRSQRNDWIWDNWLAKLCLNCKNGKSKALSKKSINS